MDEVDSKKWQERMKEKEAKKFENGKTELRQAMVDVADFVDSLPDADWVLVTVSLNRDDYFRENHLSKLYMKAKASDLRSLAKSNASDDEIAERITEAEY